MAAAPEVGVFFADWQAKKIGKTGFCDMENCITKLSEQDEEDSPHVLLMHTRPCCEAWGVSV